MSSTQSPSRRSPPTLKLIMDNFTYRAVDSNQPLKPAEKELIHNAKTLRESIPKGHGIQIVIEKATIFEFESGQRRIVLEATNGKAYKTMSVACIARILQINAKSKSQHLTLDIVSKVSAKTGNYYLFIKEI